MTDFKNCKNVLRYVFGKGATESLDSILKERNPASKDYAVYLIDHYFINDKSLRQKLPVKANDIIKFINTDNEPETPIINSLLDELRKTNGERPFAIIGIGGGSVLDTAKAISNLYNNPGKAEDYQGWDLVKFPGIYKIGIPTISGTGAETSRTCVMINPANGLKLGMNSDFTIYDQLILDPDLTKSVPVNQYYYTGMDSYIHCLESLNGRHRNSIGDAFSNQAITLCRDVFLGNDMRSDINREKLMIASYLGGCAIANSFVGVIHPFSAGLSVVLGIHHCLANCITMSAMEEFYPKEFEEFNRMAEKQHISIPRGICKDLTDKQYDELYDSTVVHVKPLANALGDDFKNILTREKVKAVFKKM